MTLDTITLANVRSRSCASHLVPFNPLHEDTSSEAVAEVPNEIRLARLQKLVDLSGSDDSLDWDALARINIEGWGADSDSH